MSLLIQQSDSRGGLVRKLQALYDETRDPAIREHLQQAAGQQFLEPADSLNTQLMDNFKRFGNPLAFSLLYELNYQHFSSVIYHRIRRYYYLLDAADILQEVFFNIYRYPFKFKADRPDSFRHWTYTIIRNTIIKYLKAQSRIDRIELGDEDLSEKMDPNTFSPLRTAIQHEDAGECSRAFLLYLYLYLAVYNRLSARERQALYLVEVQERSYKLASEEMNLKLENLKMVIFRARKKIFNLMRRVFAANPQQSLTQKGDS